jgi:cytochrome c-type biogenesis protein
VTVAAVQIESASLLVGAVLAFAGGLLSFVSPCVLPLVPGYIGYLAGTTVEERMHAARRTLVLHGLMFVLGFSAVFTVLGIAIGQLLTNVQVTQGYVRWAGGVIVILLGIHTLGLVRVPLLDRTLRLQPGAPHRPRRDSRLGIIANPEPARAANSTVAAPDVTEVGMAAALGRSFIVGICFAAGWSPCIGPILTGIYGVASTQPGHGGVLLACYSLGLGGPFMLVAALFGGARDLLQRLNRYYGIVSIISGLFLILIGVMLLTNALARLAIYAPALNIPGVS